MYLHTFTRVDNFYLTNKDHFNAAILPVMYVKTVFLFEHIYHKSGFVQIPLFKELLH